jgi:gamma-glutamylcyclotransferase (GGCT)/AIG2-like uncharacterized protein YtfP/glutaredoxin-related protein/3-polyprenyl-4-hydroxybenzoate decarboxylase
MSYENLPLLDESDLALLKTSNTDLSMLDDQVPLSSLFQLVEVPKNTTLTATGMYFVLSGHISLQLNGSEIATATVSDYFYEEYLLLEDHNIEVTAKSKTDSRLGFLAKDEWDALPEKTQTKSLSKLFGNLVNTHLHEFQQPINCCNITAAAFGLTALGYPTDVNDIFNSCALPVSYVVNDGMTIGELYDVVSSHVFASGLRDEIGVELYYFDEHLVAKEDLFAAIRESNHVGGKNDILIANFQVGIAHDNSEFKGGHFALIAKCNNSTGLVHMMDVHPEKYGKIWVTSIQRLYEAMTDHDGSAQRARGLLRFIVKKEVDVRLNALANSDCFPVNCTQYIDLTPEKRRHIFGRSSTNLNSLYVLSMGLSLLDDHAIDVDELLSAVDISYTDALSIETTAQELTNIANKYLSSNEFSELVSSHHSFDPDKDDSKESWLKTELLSIANDPKSILLINIDYNEVLGYSAIGNKNSHYRETAPLEEFWAVCIDYIYEQDVVILADMSPASSQIWRAPRAKVFRGLRENETPSALSLKKIDPPENPLDFDHIISDHKLVLFYNEEDPWSYMLKSVMSNIGATETHNVDVSGYDLNTIGLRKKITIHSGKERTPYLYFNGNCLGEIDDIMTMVREGQLQEMIQSSGLPVLLRSETPSLDNNIFSYPKGGLVEPRDGSHNVLLCCCGSSAADKIPELVERLVDAGHNVKLVPTLSSEVFFKDFGMERILKKLKPSDIYRDDDEWNFRYTEFGMPVRAAHLALCDWADCVIVAPISCNSMGKVANGVADNLMSSIFVAWQYQRKPVILSPACNTNMWNNITTQNNVGSLKRLGAHIEGPRSGILSNGRMGTGMMATVDEIMDALDNAFEGLDDHAQTIMRWGKAAAASRDPLEWQRIYRAIDEGVVGINILDDENADSLLHYAAGGEGEVTESCIERGTAAIEPMLELIKRGVNVNLRNDYYFSAMHVAMMSNSFEAVNILLSAGADISHSLAFMGKAEVSSDIKQRLQEWANLHKIKSAVTAFGDQYTKYENTEGELYFTYGSLKKGFPNHAAHADILCDFIGEAKTRQSFPLVIPQEPSCSNPNCPYLHRMAALVEVRGMGHRIRGELYRVSEQGLDELDQLEGFVGKNMDDNIYIRKKITVLLDNARYEAFTYFIADPDTHLDAVRDGTAAMAREYAADMAIGELKPGWEDPHQPN